MCMKEVWLCGIFGKPNREPRNRRDLIPTNSLKEPKKEKISSGKEAQEQVQTLVSDEEKKKRELENSEKERKFSSEKEVEGKEEEKEIEKNLKEDSTSQEANAEVQQGTYPFK
ncbi:hypothetical protein IHE45_17G085400 [Dioscorea alata]|uniref:Uncharacterized protein n=1 Tax=Dioscorea alata TaxID=55571 RepID=A0ACB7UDT0_DIOAL|nr:hypothetical protein IHE45_17G085400 [Dioscorea alata]